MKFTIGFEKDDIKMLHSYWDEIIEKQQWSEGKFSKLFEEKWKKNNKTEHALSFSSWAGGAMAALEFFDVRGKTVLCPSNTFMATPMSVIKAGGKVEFVDCNKNDLCMSFEDLKIKIEKYKPKVVWVVHIGGHIAFQIDKIAALCEQKGIILLEDCAHAHGASWNGRKAGTWGEGGIYSFYSTKTISTGEGGMLVTNNKTLADYANQYRNYGKFDYKVQGLNYRINEFGAAIGCIQTDRLDDIINWKNEYAKKHLDPKYPNRVIFPERMISGYYKYIVFDPVEKSTGKVYDQSCHKIFGKFDNLPNTDWIAKNHWCVPLYYKGE